MNFHDLKFKNLAGEEIDFSQFKGKVCLVVNIASRCGYAAQMHDLETLYLLYKQKGFEVLAFPSNDFGQQEPLDNKSISNFCAKEFLATFPIFEKSHVKGKEANAVYRYLNNWKFYGGISIRPYWNFQKYLVDRNGKVLDYFLPFTKPSSGRLRKKIESLL